MRGWAEDCEYVRGVIVGALRATPLPCPRACPLSEFGRIPNGMQPKLSVYKPHFHLI